MFDKLKDKVKVKKKDPVLDSNPINELFHSVSELPSRKEPKSRDKEETEPKLDSDSQSLEDKKRERFNKIKEKYSKVNY